MKNTDPKHNEIQITPEERAAIEKAQIVGGDLWVRFLEANPQFNSENWMRLEVGPGVALIFKVGQPEGQQEQKS